MATSQDSNAPIDVLILTMLDFELQIVLSKLPGYTSVQTSSNSNRLSFLADLSPASELGSTYKIAVVQAGIGRVKAAVVAGDAIRAWQPTYIFLVGVAGGVGSRGLALGDVIVADQIVDYEIQKITSEGGSPRYEVYRPDAQLVGIAKGLNPEDWRSLIQTPRPENGTPKSLIGPVASGDKIIASDKELVPVLKGWPTLIGIEMEGGGVAESISQISPPPKFLMIRGVSDLMSSSKQDDWRTYAADTAISFALAVIKRLPSIPATESGNIPVASGRVSQEKKGRSPKNRKSAPNTRVADQEDSSENIVAETHSQLPDYDADSTEGIDWLNIRRDVNAFASLIAARGTTPPLSIGLFGQWGSGKTFFMQQLKRRVADLSKSARDSGLPQKDIAFYKRIVQIEFNAWHYMEGNLWASLVENIFSNLCVADGQKDEIEALQEKLLADLGVQEAIKEEAKIRVEEAEAARDQAKKELGDKKQEYDKVAGQIQDLTARNIIETVFTLPDIQQDKEKLSAVLSDLGLPSLVNSAREFQSALVQAQAVAKSGTSILVPFFRAPDRGKRIAWFAIMLLAVPIFGLIVAWFVAGRSSEWFAQVAGVIATITGLFAGAAGVIRYTAGWVSERIVKLEQLQEHLNARTAEKKAEIKSEIVVLEQQLAMLEAEYVEAQRAHVEAELMVKQAQECLEQITPARLLAKFIQDRVESDDYRKHLGVLALVRRDFMKLSYYIDRENRRLDTIASIEDEKDGEAGRINRIVLYIDDLDRCPAEKVIQVLQAVHLLLAFPLFVAVVAVDARWVSGALQEKYGNLLGGEETAPNAKKMENGIDSATPLDYLEKIFQIPFWLTPMDLGARRRMIEGLFARSSSRAGQSQLVQNAGENLDTRFSPHSDKQASDQHEGSVLIQPPTLDLNPQSLVIEDAELEFVKELSPMLGRSPRALKRFVNIYRLLKTSLAASDLSDFAPEGSRAEFRLAMFVLAVVTNTPNIAHRFFRMLDDFSQTQNSNTDPEEWSEIDWFEIIQSKHKVVADLVTEPEWPRLESWLTSKTGRLVANSNVTRVVYWARRVARYSFVMESDSLTWLDAEE